MTDPANFVSAKALRTKEQPISYLMEQAVANPDIISLAAGLVDYDTLPVEETRRVMEELLSDAWAAQRALQYGTTEGFVELREQLLARYRPEGVPLSVDNVVVSSGSQQLLHLTAEALIDPDDIVLLSAPSYFVFMGTLQSTGARMIGIPMDEDGMRPDLLRTKLSELDKTGQLDRVKLVYLVTYFQNPTGISLHPSRRKEIFDIVREFQAKRHIFILEDAAYRELRYTGEDTAPVKSYDTDNDTVIYLGTFSKPYSPGMKTGFGFLPESLVTPMCQIKGSHDFGTNNFIQHVLARVMKTGLLDEHLEIVRREYIRKSAIMYDALRQHLPESAHFRKPSGGLYIWVELPPEVETGPGSALVKAALDHGVLYVPGEYCYPTESEVKKNQMRLTFGVGTVEQLSEGVKRLGEAVRAVMSGIPV